VRLVGRGAGPAVVLGDRHQRHELLSVAVLLGPAWFKGMGVGDMSLSGRRG
jgi:hypothetical protein